jgi:hypothetical protein
MSRIEGKQHVQTTQDVGSNKGLPNEPVNGEQTKSVYVANNDSVHEKFSVHEGIDRGRGNKHGLHGKKAGDKVEITDGDRTLTGIVLKDTGDTLEVLIDDQVYIVAKDTGKAKGHRKASDAEMQQAAQMQEMREEEARVQEEQAMKAEETIKEDRKRYDVKLYNKKVEQRADISEKIDNKRSELQLLSNEFHHQTVETEHQTLTLSEIILGRRREEQLRKQAE